jgi:hypothetical protein
MGITGTGTDRSFPDGAHTRTHIHWTHTRCGGFWLVMCRVSPVSPLAPQQTTTTLSTTKTTMQPNDHHHTSNNTPPSEWQTARQGQAKEQTRGGDILVRRKGGSTPWDVLRLRRLEPQVCSFFSYFIYLLIIIYYTAQTCVRQPPPTAAAVQFAPP